MARSKNTVFTDTMIRKLKPETSDYTRGEGNGFTIRVMPSGSKTWMYRYTFDGKLRKMNLGQYPEVTLETARGKFDDARRQVKNGIDVVASSEQARIERRQTPTVALFSEEYFRDIVQHPKYQLKSWQKTQHTITREIIPAIGSMKVTDVSQRDLLAITDAIVARGKLVMANRVFALAGMLMNHAVEKRVLKSNPFAGMKRPGGKESPRARVLTEAEIKTLWIALDSTRLSISSEIRRALKLVLVTCQRPGEVIGMHTSEIDGEWWTIPKERSKNGREQRVYLTTTALELIGDTTGKGYIFKTAGKTDKPMTQPAMNYAIRRQLLSPVLHNGKPVFDKAGRPVTENLLGVAAFCPHDLRRTGATMVSELKFSDEIIDALLNHKKQGIIKAYNRNRYDREKQMALEELERRLLEIIAETATTGGKVISIQTARKAA